MVSILFYSIWLERCFGWASAYWFSSFSSIFPHNNALYIDIRRIHRAIQYGMNFIGVNMFMCPLTGHIMIWIKEISHKNVRIIIVYDVFLPSHFIFLFLSLFFPSVRPAIHAVFFFLLFITPSYCWSFSGTVVSFYWICALWTTTERAQTHSFLCAYYAIFPAEKSSEDFVFAFDNHHTHTTLTRLHMHKLKLIHSRINKYYYHFYHTYPVIIELLL